MDIGFGTCCAKYLLCSFNFVIFIMSTVVLGTGVWLAVDKASLIALLKIVDNETIHEFTQPDVIQNMAFILIAIGGLMFLLSCLGYCGAIRESRCLLMTYTVFMILMLLFEIAIVCLVAFNKEKAHTETKKYLQSTITNYYKAPEHMDAVTLAWNKVMISLSCCGIDEYRDLDASEAWTRDKGNRTIPESCCILTDNQQIRDSDCTTNPSESNSYYKKGCYGELMKWLNTHMMVSIGVLLGVGIVQLFGIFLGIVLYKNFAKYEDMRL